MPFTNGWLKWISQVESEVIIRPNVSLTLCFWISILMVITSNYFTDDFSLLCVSIIYDIVSLF